MLAAVGLSVGALGGLYLSDGDALPDGSMIQRIAGATEFDRRVDERVGVTGGNTFTCKSVYIIDGDTFSCGGIRIRLEGIDAPELPGHCRRGRACTPGDPYASTENLRRLTASAAVECQRVDTDVYGRTVATCKADGADLSCSQIEGGFAVRRYGNIIC
jgi:endonuclease YncB( thermonuclease family)